MYIVIKREKTDVLKHKVKELKELACDVMECLEEAYSESRESEGREYSRRDSRYEPRRRREEYDDYEDYGRNQDMRMRY